MGEGEHLVVRGHVEPAGAQTGRAVSNIRIGEPCGDCRRFRDDPRRVELRCCTSSDCRERGQHQRMVQPAEIHAQTIPKSIGLVAWSAFALAAAGGVRYT